MLFPKINLQKFHNTIATIVFVFIIFILLFNSPPFILGNLFSIPKQGIGLFAVAVLLLSFVFKANHQVYELGKMLGFVLAIHTIFSLFHFWTNNSTLDLRFSLGLLGKYILVISLAKLLFDKYLKLFLNIFFNTFIMITGLSLAVYFLILYGVSIPSYDVILDGKRTHHIFYFFTQYFPLLASIDYTEFRSGGAIATRFCSLFDEPGRLGLIITHLLILNEISLKSNWIRRFFSFAGFFTFSLGFTISIICFFSYRIWISESRKKACLEIIYFFIVPILFIHTINLDNKAWLDLLYNSYLNRLLPESLLLNNRVQDIRYGNSFELWMQNPFFGIGSDRRNLLGTGFENIVGFLATYGMWGLLIYAPFVRIFSTLSSNYQPLMLIVFLNLLQRPEFFSIFDTIILSLYYLVPNNDVFRQVETR